MVGIRQNLRRAKWQSRLGRHFGYQALKSIFRAMALVFHFGSIKAGIRTILDVGARKGRLLFDTASDMWHRFIDLPWRAIIVTCLRLTFVAALGYSLYAFRDQIAWYDVGMFTLYGLGVIVAIAVVVAACFLILWSAQSFGRLLGWFLSRSYHLAGKTFSLIYEWIKDLPRLGVGLLLLFLGVIAKVLFLKAEGNGNSDSWEIKFLNFEVLSYSNKSISIGNVGLLCFASYSISIFSLVSFLSITLFGVSGSNDVQAQGDQVETASSEVNEDKNDRQPNSNLIPTEQPSFDEAGIIGQPDEVENFTVQLPQSVPKSGLMQALYWQPESALEVVSKSDELIDFDSTQINLSVLCSAETAIAIGMSSPSGSWLLNEQLARKRAQSLARYVIRHTRECQTPPSVVAVSFVNEEATVPRKLARSLVVTPIDRLEAKIQSEKFATYINQLFADNFHTSLVVDPESIRICLLTAARGFAGESELVEIPDCQTTW